MIKISLPNPNEYGENLKGFLRQLELAVHHAEKAYEQIIEGGETLKENLYITYRFPKIDLYSREQDNDGFAKVHVDEEGDQMQNIEIEIFEV